MGRWARPLGAWYRSLEVSAGTAQRMTGQERRRSPSFTLRSTAQSLGPRTRTVDLSGPRTRWGLCGTLGARRLQTSLRLSQSAPSLAHCRPRTHQYLGAAGRTEGCPRPKAPGPRAAPAAWQRRPGPGEGSRCWAAHRGADAAGSVRFAHPAAQHSLQARPRPLPPTTAPGPPLPSRSPAPAARWVLKTPAPPRSAPSLSRYTAGWEPRPGPTGLGVAPQPCPGSGPLPRSFVALLLRVCGPALRGSGVQSSRLPARQCPAHPESRHLQSVLAGDCARHFIEQEAAGFESEWTPLHSA